LLDVYGSVCDVDVFNPNEVQHIMKHSLPVLDFWTY